MYRFQYKEYRILDLLAYIKFDDMTKMFCLDCNKSRDLLEERLTSLLLQCHNMKVYVTFTLCRNFEKSEFA